MKDINNMKGLLYGIAYGLVSRGIFSLEDFGNDKPLLRTFGLMTVSFMFIVPFVVGLIVGYHNRSVTNSGKKSALIR